MPVALETYTAALQYVSAIRLIPDLCSCVSFSCDLPRPRLCRAPAWGVGGNKALFSSPNNHTQCPSLLILSLLHSFSYVEWVTLAAAGALVTQYLKVVAVCCYFFQFCKIPSAASRCTLGSASSWPAP